MAAVHRPKSPVSIHDEITRPGGAPPGPVKGEPRERPSSPSSPLDGEKRSRRRLTSDLVS